MAVWNPERGYGAITPREGGQEIFVHISAFPVDGAPPVSGEALSFEIVSSGDGRKQAGRVQRSSRAVPRPMEKFMAPAPQRGSAVRRQAGRRRRIGIAVIGTALLIGALGSWQLMSAREGEVPQQMAHKPGRIVR